MDSSKEALLLPAPKSRTLGFQAGLVILVPFLLASFLVVRAEAERVTRFRQAAEVSEISTRTAQLLNAETQLRNEWLLGRDTASIGTQDFASRSDEVDRRVAESLGYSNRTLLEEASRKTDIALEQLDPGVLPSAAQDRITRVDDVRQRIAADDVSPVELDLFYSRLLEDIEQTLQGELRALERSAGPQTQIDLTRQRHLTDTIAKVGTLQRQLTLVTQDLLVVNTPDWVALERVAVEASLVNDALSQFERGYAVDRLAQTSTARDALDFSDAEQLARTGFSTEDPGMLVSEALRVREQAVRYTQILVARLQNTSDDIASNGRSTRAAAQRSLIISALLFLLAVSLLLAAIRYLVRSVGQPLRRAATTAAKVSKGDLDVQLSADEGPREVRQLSSALSDLVATVSAIERQAVAMSEGELDSPVLVERLPGQLGRSLESSIGRWRDVSQQVHASNTITAAINESTSDAQLLCDADLIITEANPAASVLFGMAPSQMIGRPLPELASMSAFATIAEVGENGTITDQATVHARSGAVETVSTITRVTTDIGQVHSVLLRDVSEQQQILDRLSHEVEHDRLTGLRTRQSFVDKLQKRLDVGGVGVLVVDIDDFKQVNSLGGEWGGDQVLRMLSNRLQEDLHSSDLVARLGADEFAIAVPLPAPSTVSDLSEIADDTRSLFSTPIRVAEQLLELTTSIGFAAGNATSAEEVISDAMAAKLVAKRRGGNQSVAYDDDLAAALAHRSQVENNLKLAVPNGELELWLQPIAELSDQRICGAEALVRWPQADGTMMFPNDFIPIAEESTLIVDIDRWVIDRACEILASWEGTADDLHIAVNVSARHLTEGDLVATVAESCERWSVDPKRLGIEITESLLVADKERCEVVISRLHELGATLLIDDFGTGYSGLSYLQDLQFDVLKIDRSFVSRCTDDAKSMAIVKAMIGLGHTMGLRVHAEGIETMQQRELLAELGCDYEQGFLFSPPRPTDEFLQMYHEQPSARANHGSTGIPTQ